MFDFFIMPESFEEIAWIFPFSMGVVVFIQIIYSLFLEATSNIEDSTLAPTRPIMPQLPQNWQAGGLGALPSALAGSGLSGGGTGSSSGHGEAYFVVMAGLADTSEIQFPSSQFTVGRFHNAEQGITMAIDEKSISRKHATFSADEALGEYYITDNSSTYGTYLLQDSKFDKIPSNVQVRIYNEDVVQFGSKVRLRIAIPASDTRAEAIR